MKKLSILSLLFTALVFVGCNDDDKATIVLSFEGKLTKEGTAFEPSGGEKGEFYYETSFKDPNNILEFSHYYADWGFGGGFTYSNYTDVTTTGYKNLSAIAGKGKYATTYLTSSVGQKTVITLLKPEAYTFKGAWVTNSTYAYWVIKDGSGSYTPDSKFGSDDLFTLIAVGYNSKNERIGEVKYYLADYRNEKNKIVDTWEWFDFSPISLAEYIVFKMESTDADANGMKTPAYFCMDAITLEEK